MVFFSYYFVYFIMDELYFFYVLFKVLILMEYKILDMGREIIIFFIVYIVFLLM